MPNIDPRFIKIAEEDLPCSCKYQLHRGVCEPDCHSRLRPIFAQRLQEAFEIGCIQERRRFDESVAVDECSDGKQF